MLSGILACGTYLCALLLHLAVGPAGMVLADEQHPREVTSAEELKQALLWGASEIVFLNNITLDEALFPGAQLCNATNRLLFLQISGAHMRMLRTPVLTNCVSYICVRWLHTLFSGSCDLPFSTRMMTKQTQTRSLNGKQLNAEIRIWVNFAIVNILCCSYCNAAVYGSVRRRVVQNLRRPVYAMTQQWQA